MLRFILLAFSLLSFTSFNPEVGTVIDTFNNIPVYYNGKVTNVHGRNTTRGGYNLGLRWQCVEFVKRYYYYVFDHCMPDSYGHAKDFFDPELPDRAYNFERALVQFRNTRTYKPVVHDILIYGASRENPFGHMGIVTEVTDDEIEIIQQNWGEKTRHRINLVEYEGIYTVADFHVLGWLRMPY